MIQTIADALATQGYDSLTPVQEAVTNPDLVEADLLVSAQTGSGKTVAFGLAIALMGLVWAMQTGRSLMGPIGVFLGTWIVAGAVTDLIGRTGQSRDFSRLLRLPRADCTALPISRARMGPPGMTWPLPSPPRASPTITA